MNDFFNTYPILPIVAILFNVGACVPIVFLLLIVRKTPLHCNCRFLCNCWLAGYLALFSSSIALWIVSLLDEKGYLAQSMKNPPHRLFLYELCTSCSLYCTICEIAIALERIISTQDPEKYYNTPRASGLLISYTISLTIFSWLFGIFAFAYDQFLIAGAFLLTCDVLTLVSNSYSVRFTEKRYLGEFVNLNAKYQVKEAFQMSAAMQPVYIAIFGVKCIIGTSSIICLMSGNPYAIGYNDMFYSCANAVCASIVCVMLTRNHPQLRKHSRIWLGLHTSIVPIETNTIADTEKYFESLKSCWN